MSEGPVEKLDLGSALEQIRGIVEAQGKRDEFTAKFIQARDQARVNKRQGTEFINWGIEALRSLGRERVLRYETRTPLEEHFTGWVQDYKEFVEHERYGCHFENESEFAYFEDGRRVYEQARSADGTTERMKVIWHTPEAKVTEIYAASRPNAPRLTKFESLSELGGPV